MDVLAFIQLRRAEEERLRASRSKSEKEKEAHLTLARKFEDSAKLRTDG